MKKLCIGADHAGFELKEKLKIFLVENFSDVLDFGVFSPESIDYPDIAHPLAQEVNSGKAEKGIVICGSGNGVAMVVNKYSNIRGALCWSEKIARLARTHNNANILILPARFIDYETAENIVKIFLTTSFEGQRHQRRIDKIPIQ